MFAGLRGSPYKQGGITPSIASPPPETSPPQYNDVTAFPGGSVVNNLLAMKAMQVQSLGQEDPLEKEMATHSSVLAWRIPGTGEPGGLPSVGLHRVGHD